MISPPFKPIEILLVEDSPADIRLALETLKTSKLQNNVHIVEDGDVALDFLYRRGAYTEATPPDLVLLDLNLPTIDGQDVLKAIKQDEDLRRIPVVILTTSDAEEDILKSYSLYANCYVTKPYGFNQFVDVVRAIEHFWLSIVKLP